MMRSRRFLSTVALALALGATVPACVVRTQGSARFRTGAVVVYDEPPAPQYEQVTVRPGYLWIRGHWEWRGGRWEQPELIAENEAQIGPDGTFEVEIDTGPAKAVHADQDHKYSITAEVVDQSVEELIVLLADVFLQLAVGLPRHIPCDRERPGVRTGIDHRGLVVERVLVRP